jgi:phage gp36-like protein
VSSIAQKRIGHADALIDSYTGKIYKVPISPVPDIIADISATMAICYLHKFRSVDSKVWSDSYDQAVEFLNKVASGDVTLEGVVAEPASADDLSTSQSFTAQERRFSRDLLKGM